MSLLRTSIAAVFVSLSAGAPAEAPSDAPDPVIASPDMYRVLLDNDYVRVVEYEIAPGKRDNWHSHPAKVAYVVTGGKLRITTGTGESFDVAEEQGSVRWLGAVGKHYGENVGETPVKIVFVEVKRIDDEGQDLKGYLEQHAGQSKKD